MWGGGLPCHQRANSGLRRFRPRPGALRADNPAAAQNAAAVALVKDASLPRRHSLFMAQHLNTGPPSSAA